MTTIKEVYDQLPKEELGSERALFRVTQWGEKDTVRIYAFDSETGLILVWREERRKYEQIPPNTVGEWIGNKPKTKKLYAFLVGWENSDFGGMIYNVNRAEKHVGERHNRFIKWLPEDQYPPIEIEE